MSSVPPGSGMVDAAGWRSAMAALAGWAAASADQVPSMAAVAMGLHYLEGARAAAGSDGEPGAALGAMAAGMCTELATFGIEGALPDFFRDRPSRPPGAEIVEWLGRIAALLAAAAGLHRQVALLMRAGDPWQLDRAVELRCAAAEQAGQAAALLRQVGSAWGLAEPAKPAQVSWTGPRPIEATVALPADELEQLAMVAPRPEISLESGALIGGRYEIRDVIGAGSYGTVLEAHDRSINRLVALKMIRLPEVQDAKAADLVSTFRREAQAAGLLSHPGIVTVYDFGQEPGYAWIVMQLIIGETLEAVLERHDPIGLAEATRVTLELLDALTLAHSYGIVHRDIKAANVLLAMSEREGLGRVMLADFGVAMLGNRGVGGVGLLIGTLSTMAPEQVRGELVDHRADLWAVGVIFYHLLTGAPPFTGEGGAMMRAILLDDPVSPSARAPGLPVALDDVLAKALAKQPDARYATGSDMMQAIRGALV